MANPRHVDSTSVQVHKRQLAWQILAPFLVMTALIVVAAVLVVRGGASQTRLWTDVSIIWLIAPMLVLALLSAVILGFLIYAIARLMQVTPRYTSCAQDIAARIETGTKKAAEAVIMPFLWLRQIGAATKSFFEKR